MYICLNTSNMLLCVMKYIARVNACGSVGITLE